MQGKVRVREEVVVWPLICGMSCAREICASRGGARGIQSERDDQVRVCLGTMRFCVLTASPLFMTQVSARLRTWREIEGGAPIWFGDYHSSFHPSAVANGHADGGVGFFLGLLAFFRSERAKSDSFSEQIRPRTVDKKSRGEREEDRPTDTTTKNRPPAFVRKKTGIAHWLGNISDISL